MVHWTTRSAATASPWQMASFQTFLYGSQPHTHTLTRTTIGVASYGELGGGHVPPRLLTIYFCYFTMELYKVSHQFLMSNVFKFLHTSY